MENEQPRSSGLSPFSVNVLSYGVTTAQRLRSHPTATACALGWGVPRPALMLRHSRTDLLERCLMQASDTGKNALHESVMKRVSSRQE
jgi:hypothetical protein